MPKNLSPVLQRLIEINLETLRELSARGLGPRETVLLQEATDELARLARSRANPRPRAAVSPPE